jgi:cytochrome c-type biogenesis protein CcmF
MILIILSELGRLSLIAATSLLLSHGVSRQRIPSRVITNGIAMGTYKHASRLCFTALSILTLGFLLNDYGLRTVWLNSHTELPLMFKMTNVLGSPQGSWLLWTTLTMSAAYHAMRQAKKDDVNLDDTILTAILAIFCLYGLFLANPFTRLLPIAPDNGVDLNPLLQDPAFLIHPPCLYLGTSALLIPYTLVMSLRMNHASKHETIVLRIKQWSLWSWGWLTLGITLGSWWAYRELGWGGWWFWDPVENAALMPWLAVTALIHACMHRSVNIYWLSITASLTYITNLLGILITRSGILVSVHSFAIDTHKGFLLLLLIIGLIGYSIWHQRHIWTTNTTKRHTNHGLIRQHHILLAMTIVIAVGTMYPLIAQSLTQSKMVVGSGYYEQALMPFNLLLIWSLHRQHRQIRYSQSFAIATGLITTFCIHTIAAASWQVSQIPHLAVLTLLLGSFYMQIISYTVTRKQKTMHIAHGLLLLLGIAISCNMHYEKIGINDVTKDQEIKMGPLGVSLGSTSVQQGPNYVAEVIPVVIRSKEHTITTQPEIRYYANRAMIKSVTAIKSLWIGDVYTSIMKNRDTSITARIYFKPLQWLFWILGCALGIVGLSNALRINTRHDQRIDTT